jgi:dienelactone hydrolase
MNSPMKIALHTLLLPMLLGSSFASQANASSEPAGSDLVGVAAALPASAFFGLPNVTHPALSADGTKIAFLFPHEGRMALGVYDRPTKDARLVLRGTDESIKQFAWKGNDHLVFLADNQGNESYFIGSTDLSGKKVRRIAESHGSLGGSWTTMYVANWLPADPENIILAGWIGGDPAPRVVKLNVPASRREGLFMRPMDNVREDYVDYVVDGKAQVRFATVLKENEVILLYRDHNQAKFTEVRRDALGGEGEPWPLITASADGTKIFVIDQERSDRGELRVFNPVTRTLDAPVFTPPEGEITALLWSADYTDLIGVRYETDRLHYHWFDEQEAQLRRKVEAMFPGLEVHVISRSHDNQTQLMWAGSDRDPGTYFVLDLRTSALAPFKRLRDGIDPRLMRPMEAVVFPARDGVTLHGYLTRPFTAAHGAVPLIIFPHGGPYNVRDSWGFDPDVQFLASRGYAVLQINFRGSGGYGRSFVQKGKQQWGRAMQDDLTDGVNWAVAKGIADPKRVAIYGASYGGFAALAGVTLTPDLYCCAVNYVGITDLEITGRPAGADAWMTSTDFDYRREWVGPTREYRDATNPVKWVERIRVPTLHAYGRNDPRVDIDHWLRLEAQLRKFGKPYESMIQDHAGHGFSAEKDTIAFHTVLEKFLARHLGAPR